jgi:hypothetical protein
MALVPITSVAPPTYPAAPMIDNQHKCCEIPEEPNVMKKKGLVAR